MKLINRVKWSYIILCAVTVLSGILLIVFPRTSLVAICVAMGILILVTGIVKLIGYFSKDLFRLAFQFDLALGIFALAVGALIILHPTNIASITPVIIGVFIIMDGAFKFQTGVDAKRFGMNGWPLIMTFGALSCLGGLFLIVNPFGGEALMILLGAALTVDGIQNMFTVIYTVKTVKKEGKGAYYIEIDGEGGRENL